VRNVRVRERGSPVIRITDLGDGALVMAAGQSMCAEADWRLRVAGGANARAELAGVTARPLAEWTVDAYAGWLEGLMLRKESWQV